MQELTVSLAFGGRRKLLTNSAENNAQSQAAVATSPELESCWMHTLKNVDNHQLAELDAIVNHLKLFCKWQIDRVNQ